MANEGSVRATLSMTKGLIKRSYDSGSVKFDISEDAAEGLNTLALTDSYAALSKGSISAPHWLFIVNTHATKDALLTFDNGSTAPVIIPANGYPALIPIDPAITFTNVKAKVASDTGSIDYAVLP